MSKLFFGVVTSAGTVTHDTPELSNADADRFADYVWSAYPQFENDGTTPKARTNANLADAFRAWASAFRAWASALWAGTQANILGYERVEAERVARAGIGGWGE